MNDCVAIRANRAKVFDWVDNVGRPDSCQRDNVMNVNKMLSTFAVLSLKVEATNKAPVAVVVNASLPCSGATFVGVDSHFSLGTLNDRFGNLIRVRNVKQMAS